MKLHGSIYGDNRKKYSQLWVITDRKITFLLLQTEWMNEGMVLFTDIDEN